MNRRHALLILGIVLALGLVWFTSAPAVRRHETTSAAQQQVMHSAFPAPAGTAAPQLPLLSQSGRQTSGQDASVMAALRQIDAFAEWLGRWRQASEGERARMLADGHGLARRRRIALRQLVGRDPEAALARAIPRSLREPLPAAIRAELEEPVDAFGELEVVAVSAREPAIMRFAVVAGRRYQVFTFGHRLQSLTKAHVPLHGIALDGWLALSDQPYRRLEDPELAWEGLPLETIAVAVGDEIRAFTNAGALSEWARSMLMAESTPSPIATAAADSDADVAAWAHGEKSLLWVRAEFADDPGAPATDADIAAEMLRVNAYYDEVSRGRTSFKATVLPGTLLSSKAKSALTDTVLDPSWLLDEMKRLAKDYDAANGGTGRYDPDRYDRWVLVFKKLPFKFSGMAHVGAPGVWINGWQNAFTTTHELGHNLGLGHSCAWKPSTGSPIGAGESIEYGDFFDIMGGDGHFNTKHKRSLLYLDSSEVRKDAVGGVHRIYRHDHRHASGLQAVVIDAGTAYDYWIEYRHVVPGSYYNHLEKLRAGVTIRWGTNPALTTGIDTYLLDMTPLTDAEADGMQDAPLVLGETFVDPEYGITIMPVETGGSEPNQWVDVRVWLGASGENHNPVLQNVTHDAVVQARTEVTFTATGSDPDGDPVYYRWDFGDGQPSPATAIVKHRWLLGGNYQVKVRAIDGKGGVADRTIDVAVADPLASWTRQGQGLTANALYDVTWTGREFVAVGSTILLSPDGVAWSIAPAMPANIDMHGVTYANGRYVAVGRLWDDTGAAVVSLDGLTWTSAAVPAGAGPLEKVAFGAGRFVAVARSGKAFTSSDGATWAQSPTGVADALKAVRYAEGLFVAAGENGAIVTSPDGLSWTNRTPATCVAFFRGVARLNGVWYASTGLETWLSVDGATWQRSQRYGGPYFIHGLDVAFGVMLGVCFDGRLYVSPDEYTRTEIRPENGQTRKYYAAAEGNGTVVLVGDQGAVLQAGTPSLVAPQLVQATELATATAGEPVAIPVASRGYAKLELLVDGTIVQEVAGSASTFCWTPPDFGRHAVTVRGTLSSGATMTSQPVSMTPGLAQWDWINPKPFGGELKGAVQSEGRWWLVGGRDALLMFDSQGGITRSELGYSNSPKAIAYGQGRFVVVASSHDGLTGESKPGMITSTDGVRWTVVPLNQPSASFAAVVFDSTTGTWAACGDRAVWRSTDGATWVRCETAADRLNAIACAGGRWVAVSALGDIVTSTDGTTWTIQRVGTEGLVGVASVGGRWVVVGQNGVLLSSNDGVSWTRRDAGTTSSFCSVQNLGTGFIAATNSEIYSSADGISWTKRSDSFGDVSLAGLAVGADGAIGFGSSGRIIASADGVTWTRLSQGIARTYETVIYGGGRYVAVGDAYDASLRSSGAAIETSTDGWNWTAVPCDATHFRDVSYGGGTYVAVGRAGIYSSPDAQNWIHRSSGTTEELGTVVTAGGLHVASGADGCIVTSRDGIGWTAAVSPVKHRWLGSAHGDPGFVLVGEGGAIVTSADGAAWTTRVSGVTARLNAVAWCEGIGFVAVGEQGTVLVSSNGALWERRDPGTFTELVDIAATPLGLVAIGGNAQQVFTSVDGGVWATSILPSWVALRTITAGPQGWVAAGYNGVMLWHRGAVGTLSGPQFAQQPASQTAAVGGSVTLSAALAEGASGSLQWQRSGVNVTGATMGTLTVADVQPEQAGLYALLASGAEASSTSAPAIVGVSSAAKVVGKGQEVGADIRHPNGNVFDQVLLTGGAEAITADHRSQQITRTSFIDLDGDIVQVEFAGAGTLSLVLDQASGPAEPVNYHQPGVTYMKGHAGIIITGADENTHLSVFTVGRATANDPTGAYNILRAPDPATNDPAKNGSPLFVGHEATVYDGIADLAFVAISSSNGKFGGVRTANANYFAAQGFTGIYAPGVTFTGPVFVGEITAFDAAKPVLVLGSANDVRVTGGNMEQANGEPVQVSGVSQLRFAAGSDSHGHLFAAQPNRGIYLQDGTDVTTQIVVNP